MKTIKISDELRSKAEEWLLNVGMPILAKKKEAPVRKLSPKKEFNQCEAQNLQPGDRIKFGRYRNSKAWVVQEVRKVAYHPISLCVDSVIVTCRFPRTREIKQFSLPAERLIIRKIKV